MIRVVQFSDLHISTSEARSHSGFGYDTDETSEAVFAHAFGGPAPQIDLVICTGDIADHGWATEYTKAQSALERLPVPVIVAPGNHDRQAAFEACLPTGNVAYQRTARAGSWLFLFADSNLYGRETNEAGRLVDTEQRTAGSGQLGAAEAAWIDEMIETTDAEHVFIWVHHPPAMEGIVATYMSPSYHREFLDLVDHHPKIRGVGAGHVHADIVADLAGVPVFVCPAFTYNLDYQAGTLLPPGYRTYSFDDDGTVSSVCHLLDDDRWPRAELPDVVVSYFRGETTLDDVKTALNIAAAAPSPF